MPKIKEILETVSPILIKPTTSSITVGLSKRFFLFELMNKIVNLIEEDPYLNFIAILKSYKVLGKFLHGTLHEFYRDRNKLYFKNFFHDRELYREVKEDIEWLYPKHRDLKMTITKRGVIIYDNYKKGRFNVLLMTIHSGTWVPQEIENKLSISKQDRYLEEDIDTHKMYSRLVLEKGGIWIDNKQSRFVIDFNRSVDRAIYADNSEEWVKIIWESALTQSETEAIFASYREFYFTLSKLLELYHFNIILDGHSMKHKPGRPNISFGTGAIPPFYMPIVKGMQRKMISMDYSPVLLNTPYTGGYILYWLNERYPDIFILSLEINKRLYMTTNRRRVLKRKLRRIADDITKIFEIRFDDDSHEKRVWYQNP